MMRFKKYRTEIIVLASLLGCFWGSVHAQSNLRLTGQVVDALSGAPISGAVVQVRGSSRQDRTDLSGRFALGYLPAGLYDLEVRAAGYQAQQVRGVQVGEAFARWLTISLLPQDLAVDTVQVVASGGRETPEVGVIVLEGRQLAAARRLGIRRLLEQVAGLSVDSPDGAGSTARVRIHGSRASQVLVLLDGQRLNLPASGEVDIERIPVDQLVRVEIIRRGDYTRYGGQAYAGVVHFQTRRWVHQPRLSLAGERNAFHAGSATLSGQWNGGRWSGSGQLIRRYGRQDFPYSYQGEQIRRANAWFSRTGGFLQLSRGTSASLTSLSVELQRTRRGLPSAFFNEMNPAGAWMEEKLASVNGRFSRELSERSSLDIQLAWNRVVQRFVNTRAPSAVLRYHTAQTNQTGEFRLRLNWQPVPFLRSELGLQTLREALLGENLLYPRLSMGEHRRWSRALYWLGRWRLPVWPALWRQLSLHTGIRLERYFDQAAQLFPQASLTLQPSRFDGLSLSAAAGRAARYPDFNSLFWKGDARAMGNPNLLPEEKTYWLVEARWQTGGILRPAVSMTYFRESLTHLIFWHRRFDGVWQPQNEDRARKQGLDADLTLALLPDRLRLSLAYSWLEAINLSPEPNRHGRRIVFTPDQMLNGTLDLALDPVGLTIRGRYVGSRETLPANPRESRLEPYWVWDLYLSLTFPLKGSRWQLEAKFTNLFSARYQLIFGYPMPGRAVGVGFRLTLPGEGS